MKISKVTDYAALNISNKCGFASPNQYCMKTVSIQCKYEETKYQHCVTVTSAMSFWVYLWSPVNKENVKERFFYQT